MKPTTIYRRLLLLAAIPALVLAACTQDDALTPGGGDESRTPVTFTAAIQNAATPATRTAPGADAAQTLWTADDRIAVFMLPAGGKIPADTLPAAHNVPYSIDPATGVMTQAVPMIPDTATGTTVPGVIVPMFYPTMHDEVDFVAYYPYRPTLELDDPRIPNPYIHDAGLRDQTTPEKQLRSDYLFSDNARGIRRSKDAVSLRFRHLNAKLRLDITLAEDLAGGKVTAVKLSGMPYAVDFDMRDGSVNKLYSSLDGPPIPCLPLPSPAAAGATATFTALVPPHSGEAYPGRKITVTVDGMDYTGFIPDADAYTGNTMYAYPVTVTHQGVTVSAPNNDVPWTDAATMPAGYDLTIANETELRRFAELVNAGGKLPNGTLAAEAKVLQTANITLTQEEKWTPIGIGDNLFLGTYNGDGHTITGLTITTAPQPDAYDAAYAGLFGFVGNPVLTDGEQQAVLTGIHLRKVQIDIPAGSGETSLYVGSIAGEIYNSTLSLCSAEGTVKASSGAKNVCAGGIVGGNIFSTISRCRATVKTTAATTTHTDGYAFAGEISGRNEIFSFILSCEAGGMPVTAEASKSARAGGITGWNMGTCLIAFCRTGANVVTAQNGTEINFAGGLVGENNGFLYSCYSRATAEAPAGTGSKQAGAIVGSNYEPDDVQYCYGTGDIGPGTSGLAADPGLGIYYHTSPGSDAIFDAVTAYTGMVESISLGVGVAYPFATRHTSATYPAHGITPVRVKWGADAWQRGTNTSYPEIDMTYGGEDNPVAP